MPKMKYFDEIALKWIELDAKNADTLNGKSSLTIEQNANSYTDTKVAEIVDSAPETLNTLKELSQALGDDPNFATTVSNQIGSKYTKPSTGVPFTDLDATVQSSLNKADTAIQTLPSGTTSAKGIVQLSSSTSSTSTTLAATPSAVKSAYDKANTTQTDIGAKSSLLTLDKSNLVGAVNELFTSASEVKNKVATAITGKGVPASSSDTGQQLADKISQIQTGASLAELIDAGVSIETLLELGYTKQEFEELGIYLDSTGYLSPAPIRLQQGDLMAGYYGKTTGLITGNDLFAKTGLTAGTTAVSGDITWLKFSHNHKTLFIADRPLKHSISWDMIQAQNLVKGKAIEINGQYYLCRLMTGGNSNPASSKGGEWSGLLVRFTPNSEDSHWNEEVTWCQEISTYNIGYRIYRGRFSLDEFIYNSSYNSSSSSASFQGYRPVLEVL